MKAAVFWASAAVSVVELLRKISPNTTAMMNGTARVPTQNRGLLMVRTNSKPETVPRLCWATVMPFASQGRRRTAGAASACVLVAVDPDKDFLQRDLGGGEPGRLTPAAMRSLRMAASSVLSVMDSSA